MVAPDRRTYDAEGNRTLRYVDENDNGVADAGDTDLTSYTWDNRNRLTRIVERAAHGGAATAMIDYLYDVANRRIGGLYDTDGDNVVDRGERYHWSGDHVLLDFVDPDGDAGGDPLAVDRRYLTGHAVDQVFAQEEATGDGATEDVRWLLPDQQGSNRDLAQYDDGPDTTSVVSHFTIDSYGNATATEGSLEDTRYLWGQLQYDVRAGQYYARARWYDPRTGEFESEDPLGFGANDPNLRRYVGNSPTMGVDPSGLAETPVAPIYDTSNKVVWVFNEELFVWEMHSLYRTPLESAPNLYPILQQIEGTPKLVNNYVPGPNPTAANPNMASNDDLSMLEAGLFGTWWGISGLGKVLTMPFRLCGADFSSQDADREWAKNRLFSSSDRITVPVTDAVNLGTGGAILAILGLQGAATLEAGGVLGVTNIGVVPIQAIPATASVELTVVGTTGTVFPAAYLTSLGSGPPLAVQCVRSANPSGSFDSVLSKKAPLDAPSANRALVNAADEVLQQAAWAERTVGAETVHGFRIYGNKGLVGSTYNRNILLIEAEQVGATMPRALLGAFEQEAAAAGASRISVMGHAVVNPKLMNLNPQLMQRLGWTVEQINGETILLTKPLR